MAARTRKDDDKPEPERTRGGSGATRSDDDGADSAKPRAPSRSRAKKAASREAQSTGTARSVPARRGALSALASGLEEIVPGIEILDRDLVFDEGGRADLACVDPSGKLYLVLLADAEADRIVLDALDAYTFAEKNGALLARHLGRKRGIRNIQVLVICLEATERLYERFALLRARGVGLYRVRSVQSASGEHSYLVPWGDAEPGASRASIDHFLARLSAPEVALVRGLREKLSRLDESLGPETHNGSLVWRAEGEELLRLEPGADGLEAFLTPETSPRRLSAEHDLDGLAEDALQRLVLRWGTGGPRPAGETDLPDSSTQEGGSEPEPSSEPLAGDPVGDGPILTPEEIDAFRD